MNSRKAFSLIELLVVLGIMAMLAGMLFPAVDAARQKARRAQDAAHLRQIVLSYLALSQDGLRPPAFQATTPQQWAAELAARTGLDDPRLFLCSEDPLLAGLTPPARILRTARQAASIDPTFLQTPLSLTFSSRISTSSAPSQTPIAWTRGLTPDGHWNGPNPRTPPVYGADGGYIAFLDGHVRFYSDLTADGGQLRHWQTGQPTSNIAEALGPNPLILESLL